MLFAANNAANVIPIEPHIKIKLKNFLLYNPMQLSTHTQ